MLNVRKKMQDLAKKINGRYSNNNGQHIVTKIENNKIYDIFYTETRRRFILKNIETEEKIFIKKRNAVITFFE